MEQLTEINDPRLVKALAHPLRVRILRVLETQVASPNDIAKLVGIPVSNVSYHMRQLANLKLVELVRTEQRRGATEHYFKSSGRVSVSADAWGQMPGAAKSGLVGTVLSEIGNLTTQAAEAGGFDHEGIILSRRTFNVDDPGFRALSAAAMEYLERVREIEAEIADRIGESAELTEEATNATVVSMVFLDSKEIS